MSTTPQIDFSKYEQQAPPSGAKQQIDFSKYESQAATSDATPLEQQGPIRRFATRALGLPEGVFDRPGDYLNPFSKGYWDKTRHPLPPVESPANMRDYPGKQTLADVKAGNYAGAAGDVLPDALAVAQLAVPAAGNAMQRPFVARNAARAGRVVGGGAGYKVGGLPGAVVGGAIGDLAARGLTKIAPWMARSVGVAAPAERPGVFAPDTSSRMGPLTEPETTQPGVWAPDSSIQRPMEGPAPAPPAAKPAQSRGGYGLSPQSTEELLEPPGKNASQYGLSPQSREELKQIMAEPPPGPNKPGMVTSGGTSTGPNWEELRQAYNTRQITRAQQANLAGEGIPAKPPTAESQAWTDAIANFGTPDQPVDMNPYYGKTRQTGMPTPSNLRGNQRQLYGPTASTAPNPTIPNTPAPEPAAPVHPENIERILRTPGEPSEDQMGILQDYFARQRFQNMLQRGAVQQTPGHKFDLSNLKIANKTPMLELSEGGNELGHITLHLDQDLPNSATTFLPEVPEALQGQGYGKELYRGAFDYAKQLGKYFVQSDPDTARSPQATRTWESLARDNPDAITKPGDRYVVDLRKWGGPPKPSLALSAEHLGGRTWRVRDNSGKELTTVYDAGSADEAVAIGRRRMATSGR